MDKFTAEGKLLAFARVLIEVSPLPNQITYSCIGEIFNQEVVYPWKPRDCSHCKTFTHSNGNCPIQVPQAKTNTVHQPQQKPHMGTGPNNSPKKLVGVIGKPDKAAPSSESWKTQKPKHKARANQLTVPNSKIANPGRFQILGNLEEDH